MDNIAVLGESEPDFVQKIAPIYRIVCHDGILIGNLGADPEIRHTQDGRPIANLRIATSESWRDKATGERKEKSGSRW